MINVNFPHSEAMEDFLDNKEGQPCMERGTLDMEAKTWGQPDMSAYTDENDFHELCSSQLHHQQSRSVA
ncbi:hypothetical protein Tco_1519468 [Tanacetum coccineum]